MTTRHERAAVVAALVLLAVASLLARESLEKNQRLASPTVFSRRAGGLSLFRDFLRADTKGTALLDDEELDGVEALVLFGPTRPPTDREERLIADYVKGGGKLVVSFHAEAQLQAVSALLREVLRAKTLFAKNPAFKNGEPEIVNGLATSLTRAGESYAVYAPWIIDDAACTARRFECFFREIAVDDGSVFLFAGLPPVANGLVTREENRRILFRLETWAAPLLVDEYHHFFSAKEITELLQEPRFLLPLVLILSLAVLFLVFAWTPFHEAALVRGPAKPPPPLHDLAESLTRRLLDDPKSYAAALELPAETIGRLFPDEKKRASELAAGGAATMPSLLAQGRRLLRLHHDCLKQRGRAR